MCHKNIRLLINNKTQYFHNKIYEDSVMIANLIFSFFNEEMVFNCRPNHQSDFKGIFWFFFLSI